MKVNDEFKGKEVINTQGEELGVIEDIEMDTISFQITHIIVSEGGVSGKLGMGKETVIPVSEVETIGEKVIMK